jgi:hypothetical protein
MQGDCKLPFLHIHSHAFETMPDQLADRAFAYRVGQDWNSLYLCQSEKQGHYFYIYKSALK